MGFNSPSSALEMGKKLKLKAGEGLEIYAQGLPCSLARAVAVGGHGRNGAMQSNRYLSTRKLLVILLVVALFLDQQNLLLFIFNSLNRHGCTTLIPSLRQSCLLLFIKASY